MEQSDRSRETVGGLGEEALVARLVGTLAPGSGVVTGPGDDCAVVVSGGGEWLLLKTDSLVEGVHFLPGTDPVMVGRKAMNRALSDIAAMGGWPAHALVSLAVESGRSLAEVEGWYEGLSEAAAAFGCGIVGGETTRLPFTGAVLTVSMSGTVAPDECVLRSGAVPGDRILVTGSLGGSFASGRHLAFTPRLREARWLVTRHRPTAMMDLSDGLGSDLPRLAAASGAGYRVGSDALPCHVGSTSEEAAADGEDYELLFTIGPEAIGELMADWAAAFPGTPLTVIGEITEEGAGSLPRGWEHYRER
ncbi:MAG: thiamine-phosphate kinase [Verrucomicrobia bacterium]|jgi:thiamine-monophosphate kinase|nr:thiamine-phosphate kinase [Verrucomicrobiota bacterium]